MHLELIAHISSGPTYLATNPCFCPSFLTFHMHTVTVHFICCFYIWEAHLSSSWQFSSVQNGFKTVCTPLLCDVAWVFCCNVVNVVHIYGQLTQSGIQWLSGHYFSQHWTVEFSITISAFELQRRRLPEAN